MRIDSATIRLALSMTRSKRSATETEILSQLKLGDWGLPPLCLEAIEINGGTKDLGFDAVVSLGWRGKSHRFGVEVKRLWTPKVVEQATDQVLRYAAINQLSPMIVVPFLSEERLRELESRGISGIDLCGNGVVIVPGELLVFRSGSANQYRWEGQIKNVYRGASAIVARLFLLVKEFASLGEVLEQTHARNGKVTLPTVSKVCKSLEQDLVIERTPGQTRRARGLRLLQPEKLLDRLDENYVPPKVGRVWTGKFTGTPETLVERLSECEERGEGRVVLNGASSVPAYAVMAREPVQTFYCSDVTALTKGMGDVLAETERFADVKLLETRDEFVYFDRRPGLVASPVQTYLELAMGEKRERETAEQVRRLILSQVAEGTNAR